MTAALSPLPAVSILVAVHMTCKISQRSQREYSLIALDARLNYLDQRGFLQPLRAGAVQGRVGRAVDLRQPRGLCRLEVGAVLRGRVAQRQGS